MSCSKLTSRLESMLKCGVCREVVKKPQTLSCFHSFCSSCVSLCRKTTVAEETGVHCPLCNSFSAQKFVKSSFLMNELLDMHQKAESGGNMCQHCDKFESKWKCIDCRMDLCQECKVNHRKIPSLRNHRIIEKGSEEEIIVDALVFCKIHPDEAVKFNCKECEEPMCIKCKVTMHDGHKTETIEDTLQRLLPEVKANKEKLLEQITSFDEDQKVLTDKITEVKDSFTTCRDESRNNLNEVIEQLKTQHGAEMKQLDMKEEEEVGKLEVARAEVETRRKELSQVCEWVDTSIEAARGVTLMTEMQAGLYSKVLSMAKSKPSTKVVVELPDFKAEENENKHIIGSISYSKKIVSSNKQGFNFGQVESFEEIFARKLQCQNKVSLPGRATRMGLVNGNIWIAVPRYSIIQVVSEEAQLLKKIPRQNGPHSVKQAANGDIILASDSGLEIIDEKGKTITRIKQGKFCDVSVYGDKFAALDYSRHEVSVWKHEEVSGAWKQMSCFRERNENSHDEGTVLLINDTVYCISMYGNNTVDEYNEDGKFVRQHTPPNPRNIFLCGHDSKEDIVIANCSNNRLILYQNGAFQNINVAGVQNPADVMCMPDGGSVWVVSPDHRVIIKYA